MKRWFILFLVIFVSYSNLYAFTIQTNPPIIIGDWACYCKVNSCECKLAEAVVITIFPEDKKKHWKKYAALDIFGEKVCATKCILHIGEVIQVRLSFLSQALNNKNEKNKVLTKKKTITQNEKSSSTTSPGAGGTSISAVMEEAQNILKEKSISQMQSEALAKNLDLTTYFILELTKKQKGNVNLKNVLSVVEELLKLNREGKINL